MAAKIKPGKKESFIKKIQAAVALPQTAVKKQRGRPKGSKTRPDAPSRLNPPLRDVNGHFAGSNPNLKNVPVAAAEPSAQIAPAAVKSRPDTELFGNLKTPRDTVPPGQKNPADLPPVDDLPPDDDLPPVDDLPPDDDLPKEEIKPEDHRAMATVVWDSIVNLLAMMIGVFWLPRPVGKNVKAGEIPYDEREMVISAWCKYFASIGLSIMTPAQELYMAIFGYAMPRFRDSFIWLKSILAKKVKTAPQPDKNDSRIAPDAKPSPGAETVKPAETTAPLATENSVKGNNTFELL